MKKRRVSRSFQLFFARIKRMVTQPIFIALTLLGNFTVFGSAYVLFRIERFTNPNIDSYLDTLWWAFATVTTVGYGDVIPVTDHGRILGIFTIIVGAALFWSYTALFAEALLAQDINDFETQLRAVSRSLTNLSQAEIAERKEVQELIESIQKQLKALAR